MHSFVSLDAVQLEIKDYRYGFSHLFCTRQKSIDSALSFDTISLHLDKILISPLSIETYKFYFKIEIILE